MSTSFAPPPRAIHSQDDFFSLVERNVDGILVIDPLGHILYANRSAARMLGRSAEELRGELFGVPICPDDASDIVLHGRHGETRFAEMRLVDFHWEGRSALLATLRDVTERKRMQEEADEAVRLRDQFLAMLSHELRNPVGAISNAARVIERAQGNRELTLQAAEVASRQARQMGRLLDDLLDVTRVTRGQIELQRQPIDLALVVSGALDSAGPIIAMRGHKLSVDCPEGTYFVEGDPARLQQILDNLLTNAAKYTPDGGEIDLRVEGSEEEVLVRVRDSGVGIPEAIRKRIFELFVQADDTLDRARGGLGIGLTLVRMLVEMHQGAVTVDSQDTRPGSEFTVRLPRVEAPPPQQVWDAAPSYTADVGTLILVDDNVDARSMLQTYMELHGYRVLVATDGQEAVESILEHRPRIAVVDIGLPTLDGYEVARQLRETLSTDHLKLIALTGYGQNSDRKRALAAGFDEHLVKPVDLDRLLQVINAAAWSDGDGAGTRPRGVRSVGQARDSAGAVTTL